MLKIENNVNLKELEKYGFNITYYSIYDVNGNFISNKVKDITYISKYTSTTIYISKKNREIIINESFLDNIALDMLYDLIKADLVEKVEDINDKRM